LDRAVLSIAHTLDDVERSELPQQHKHHDDDDHQERQQHTQQTCEVDVVMRFGGPPSSRDQLVAAFHLRGNLIDKQPRHGGGSTPEDHETKPYETRAVSLFLTLDPHHSSFIDPSLLSFSYPS
jgi:hypothetical protein